MIDFVGMILQFHHKYRHGQASFPRIPNDETVDLRYKLIEEEMSETLGALRDIMNKTPANEIELLTELADGIADSMVVLIGTAISFGIPIEEVFTEVHRSNMTKSTEKNDYGKTIKGPNFEPPKIREIIQKIYNLQEPRTGKGSLD